MGARAKTIREIKQDASISDNTAKGLGVRDAVNWPVSGVILEMRKNERSVAQGVSLQWVMATLKVKL
jgi:hypothetical protein